MYIYKIYSIDENIKQFYIGSSKNVKRRFREHKTRFNCGVKNCNDKLYDFIKSNGGFEKFKYDILEEFENITLKELHIKENDYIKNLKPTLNAIRSYRTKEDIRESCKINARAYRERIRNDPIKNKEFLKIRAEEKIKKYHERKKLGLVYPSDNKRYKCECGSDIEFRKRKRHFLTKKHLEFIKVN